MKLPAIRLSRLWPCLVWCAVGVILFWPVRGYYVALPAPDSAPFFPAAHRLRYIEQFLAGNTALSPHHLFSLLLPPLVHHDLIYLLDTLLIAAGCAYFLRGRDLPPAAAWIGGGILAFAGYSFTLISAGHIASDFPDVIRHAETPLVRTAPVPMYRLAKLTRERGIKVVLTGEGADELFAEAVLETLAQPGCRASRSRQATERWGWDTLAASVDLAYQHSLVYKE